MGDSDDDYERRDRGRDKFRRERSDYDAGRSGRREDWGDDARRSGGGGSGGWNQGSRDRGRRDNYGRDYGNQRRERYSPADRGDDPPMKRMRRDGWDDRGYDRGAYGESYGGHGNWGPPESPYAAPYHPPAAQGNQPREGGDNFPTQPLIMTFKHFLAGLDDSVAETDAVAKYNEYKMNFKKDQITEFFNKHKEEEWFRSKYHPEECDKGKEFKKASIALRLRVFNDLLEAGWIDNVSIDVEKNVQIVRLLDAAVIKLEGGTDLDLESLDTEYVENDKPNTDSTISLFAVETEKSLKTEEASDQVPEKVNDSQDSQENGGSIKAEEGIAEIKDEFENGDIQVKEEKPDVENENQSNVENTENEGDVPIKPELPEIKSELQSDDANDEKKPRHLHKTASIFLRNIAPSVSKKEIEDECKKIKGYLRIALAEPQPERRFYRRGWVTFERTVNIRDICWNVNAIKFGGVETGAIINRDLSRRIRSVNGIASHKNVIRADIRHAAKIVFNLDQQRNLWLDDETAGEEAADVPKSGRPPFGIHSKNPLLKNITDYLIEEASAEEEELLGGEVGEIEEGETDAGSAIGQSLERDEKLIKVLDKLLIYLRIVHSVDYYNHTDYPQEDEMPNRIGIMHARGSPPSSKITSSEVNEYIKTFESKIQPYLLPPPTVTEEDAIKLGKQDPEEEVKKFIEKNTEFLSPGKYFCPLSKKKFKGPEFVRKHIENKYPENLESIQKDVAYFNNYLADPKRPQLPEHPSNRPPQGQPPREAAAPPPPGAPYGPYPPHGPYPPPYMPYGPPRGGPPMPGFGGPMAWHAPMRGAFPLTGRGKGRKNYRDWDAPEED